VSNVDYLGLVALYHLDRSSGREIEKAFVVPLGLGLGLPETVGGADVTFAVPGFRCAMRVEAGGTRLMVETRDRRAGALRADVLVELPEGHETLGVVIPWSERRFQYTSKHVARPARGSVEVGGTTHELEEATNAYGCLDYGRGVWAYSVHWNWGAAAGTSGGRVVGLQLGGTWTDGTGSTENAVTVDGRLSKISDDLRFGFSSAEPMSPWRITTARSDDVDLVFRPEHVHRTRIELGVVGVDVPQYFGRYAGEVSTESGRVGVDDLYGWAEDAKMRW